MAWSLRLLQVLDRLDSMDSAMAEQLREQAAITSLSAYDLAMEAQRCLEKYHGRESNIEKASEKK